MEVRVPTVFAVGLWVASGLAVMTYTLVAFKETATGVEAAGLSIAEAVGSASSPLVASAAVLAAEEVEKQIKPERNRFNKRSPASG
jgi:hypothetical protein